MSDRVVLAVRVSASLAGYKPATRYPASLSLLCFSWSARWLFALLMLLCLNFNTWAAAMVDQDFNGDGKPDLLWFRTDCNGIYGNPDCGELFIWQMNGFNYNNVSNVVQSFGTNMYAGQWYAGGDFGSAPNGVPSNTMDGQPDLIWRYENSDITIILYLDINPNSATYLRALASAQIIAFPGVDWKIVGTGDFGSWTNGASAAKDGKGDILWQNKVTGQKAIWYMAGATRLGIQTFTPNSPLNAAGWNLAAVGDFGSSTNNSTKDGQPDFLLVNQTVFPGQLGIQYTANSQGLVLGQAGIVINPQIITNGFPAVTNLFTFGDGDLRIFNAGDFGAFANILVTNFNGAVGTGYVPTLPADNKTDAVVRHQTDGRTSFFLMDGINFKTEAVMNPQRFDTVWRLCPQDPFPSTWRITNTPVTTLSPIPRLTATPFVGSPARIDLVLSNFQLNPFGNNHLNLFRRLAGATNWPANPFVDLTDTNNLTFSDTTIVVGQQYEYRALNTQYASSVAYTPIVGVNINLPAVHNRGKTLLLIETNLASQISASLNVFTNDLIGDGWQVVINSNAPRHYDIWTNAVPNSNNVVAVKSWIKANTDASTKTVIILGHVTVPYSGITASDGHIQAPAHEGAWSADLFYGDIVGDALWVDGPQTKHNSNFAPDNTQDPGDGKFSNDNAPALIQLAVGRIDFARLTSFTNAAYATSIQPGEVGLIQQYLNKEHLYRVWQTTFAFPKKNITTTYVDFGLSAVDAWRNTEALFGSWPGKLDVGEPFRDNSNYFTVPNKYFWAFTQGGGGNEQIYNTSFTFFNPSGLQVTTDFIRDNAEPPIVFWAIHGSFLADYNLPNSLARAILAKPNYGLAVLASSSTQFPDLGRGDPRWRLDLLALGDTLGAAFLHSINNNYIANDSFPTIHRWLNILGDPTLRLNPIKPPATFGGTRTGTTINLSWSGGQRGSTYFVYRSASTAGPYTLLTQTPVAGTTFITNSSPTEINYMLRASVLIATGLGSYTNLSQGLTTVIP